MKYLNWSTFLLMMLCLMSDYVGCYVIIMYAYVCSCVMFELVMYTSSHHLSDCFMIVSNPAYLIEYVTTTRLQQCLNPPQSVG